MPLVLDELKRRGARIVDPPSFIRNSLTEICGDAVHYVSGPVVRTFLRSKTTQQIAGGDILLSSAIALFKYCLMGAESMPQILLCEY